MDNDSGEPSEEIEEQVNIETNGNAIQPLRKTPLYQAIHAARYQRQALIKEIQDDTGRTLICYVSGNAAMIDREDVLPFVDLLYNIGGNVDLDLLLHTGGGDIDAAEKLINILHTRVGTGTLRVIVPDFAKSAGTLMCLGANKIVMSDFSELGPIDPQIVLDDGRGNRIRHPVLSYIDAYNAHREELIRNPADVTARIMMNKIDPATLKVFESVCLRAQKLAEQQLQQWMFQQTGGNFTLIAAELMDNKKWQSHGQMIDWQAATKMGLQVEYQPHNSKSWDRYWQLFNYQRLSIKDNEKLFESAYASLPVDGSRT